MSIFQEQISRKPNHYPWAEDFISAMWANFWSPNDFSFKGDIHHFHTVLSEEERGVVTRNLSAISQVEIAVKKFWSRLGDNCPHPALNDLGLVMSHVEVIHNGAYEKLVEVLGMESIFLENLKLPIIKGRVNYLRKYLDKPYKSNRKGFLFSVQSFLSKRFGFFDKFFSRSLEEHQKSVRKDYVYSLILFTLFVENVSLFSQFYVVLWFHSFKNVLFDTSQQVQYTKNEENLHALAGIKIINTIRSEHPELFDADLENRVAEEAEAAFEAESKIVDWILGEYEGENLSKEILKAYIKNRINESLSQIGFDRVFSVEESLLAQTVWMEEVVHGNTKTDFFHTRPTDYAKHNVDYSTDELFAFTLD